MAKAKPTHLIFSNPPAESLWRAIGDEQPELAACVLASKGPSETDEQDPPGPDHSLPLEIGRGQLFHWLGIMPKDFAFTGTTWSSAGVVRPQRMNPIFSTFESRTSKTRQTFNQMAVVVVRPH